MSGDVPMSGLAGRSLEPPAFVTANERTSRGSKVTFRRHPERPAFKLAAEDTQVRRYARLAFMAPTVGSR